MIGIAARMENRKSNISIFNHNELDRYTFLVRSKANERKHKNALTCIYSGRIFYFACSFVLFACAFDIICASSFDSIRHVSDCNNCSRRCYYFSSFDLLCVRAWAQLHVNIRCGKFIFLVQTTDSDTHRNNRHQPSANDELQWRKKVEWKPQ